MIFGLRLSPEDAVRLVAEKDAEGLAGQDEGLEGAPPRRTQRVNNLVPLSDIDHFVAVETQVPLDTPGKLPDEGVTTQTELGPVIIDPPQVGQRGLVHPEGGRGKNVDQQIVRLFFIVISRKAQPAGEERQVQPDVVLSRPLPGQRRVAEPGQGNFGLNNRVATPEGSQPAGADVIDRAPTRNVLATGHPVPQPDFEIINTIHALHECFLPQTVGQGYGGEEVPAVSLT